MKYLVIYEPTDTGYSAYVPALPGCAATGSTKEEASERIKEAIHLHIESLRSHGEYVPPPDSVETELVDAA